MFMRDPKRRSPDVSDDPLDVDETPDLSSSMPKKRWTKLHQLLHDNHGVRYFVMALAVIIAGGLVVLNLMRTDSDTSTRATGIMVPPKEPAKVYYSPLTGAATEQAKTTRPITAIMIENSTDARPQSGLKDAGIVYEAVAEGGITRFLALYQESRPSLIGPVRSVRPYYVEWASAYDPAVAHVGGSQHALTMIRSGNYGVDMDEFFNPKTLWRVNDRAAPHNVYTSFDALDALEAAKGKTASTFTAFKRADGKKSDAPTATSIDIAVSSGQFAVHYAYDAGSNTYLRSHGSTPHVDREAGQIAPAVVVAIKVNESTALEGDGYREQITTTGSGTAYVFQNGLVTEGTWSRDGEKSPLLLKDSAGNELTLNRGQTWITALSTSRSVSWQ